VTDVLAKRVLHGFVPPKRLKLSEWAEAQVRLPEGVSAQPGPLRLWPWATEIANAIGNPFVERVTLQKGTRLGFSTLVVATIGSYAVNEPCPVLLLLPTADDARDVIVSDIEPIFSASPVLRDVLKDDSEEASRNTLLSRRFPGGGSLKIVSARAPRNLRHHTARILIVDEADACEATAEGNPIKLAERRTLSYSNRKIVIGSTPIFADTSHVLKSYGESDARVFEVCCPQCAHWFEISWSSIVWPEGKPLEAHCVCPSCGGVIEESAKAVLVTAGRWRITRPDVKDHAGFRLSALVSLLPNASWGRLATEFVEAKNDPAELQVFVNTILGQGWSSPAIVDEGTLAARAEPFDLDHLPREVLLLCAGTDVQDDRSETLICGWTRDGTCLVLSHNVIWGSFTDKATWQELDDLLRGSWKHPLGGRLKIEAACIDAGDGDHYDSVLNFCVPKMSRRIYAIKGMFGARTAFASAKGKRISNRLFLVGVDTIKNVIFQRLQSGRSIRFSHTLEPVFYEQLASERRVIRYSRGMPVRRFERVSSRARAEGLDALVYATA
jgi:phage terminase large subunit GpA-like protein